MWCERYGLRWSKASIIELLMWLWMMLCLIILLFHSNNVISTHTHTQTHVEKNTIIECAHVCMHYMRTGYHCAKRHNKWKRKEFFFLQIKYMLFSVWFGVAAVATTAVILTSICIYPECANWKFIHCCDFISKYRDRQQHSKNDTWACAEKYILLFAFLCVCVCAFFLSIAVSLLLRED